MIENTRPNLGMVISGMRGMYRMLALALLGAALAGCGLVEDKTPDYRYRLTVEVDTPHGLRTGSSVIEVETSVASSRSIPTPGAVRHKVQGEAVAVDLPGGKVLFALLRSGNDIDWASRVMFMLASDVQTETFERRFDKMLALDGEMTLPRTWPPVGHLDERAAYPMLVTFGDLADPTSVELVDPEDLGTIFGEGVSLKRITVEMTDDPVTNGIEERLGWLPDYYDKMLDGQTTNTIYAKYRLANDLSRGDFSRGLLK